MLNLQPSFAASVDCVLRHRPHHQRYAAWLAWLAIALIVVAPAISRVMPMPVSMHAMMAMGGDCPHAMAMVEHGGHPDQPPDATDRCGYCVLLDQQSLLQSAGVPMQLPWLPTAPIAPLVRPPAMASTPLLSAAPRGPPSLV